MDMEYDLSRDRGIPPSDDRTMLSLLYSYSRLSKERIEASS